MLVGFERSSSRAQRDRLPQAARRVWRSRINPTPSELARRGNVLSEATSGKPAQQDNPTPSDVRSTRLLAAGVRGGKIGFLLPEANPTLRSCQFRSRQCPNKRDFILHI